jgi:arylsulfatase A-like enzyme
VGLCTLALSCGWGIADSKHVDLKPPNILFLPIDDLKTIGGFWSEMPGSFIKTIYPNPEDRKKLRKFFTPNIDKLVAQSVNFTNAYCASPACIPSRAALMTGVHPRVSGLTSNSAAKDTERGYFRDYKKDGVAIFEKVKTLSEHLKDHGYYVAGIGKVFHGLDPKRADMPRSWHHYGEITEKVFTKKNSKPSKWSVGLKFGQEGPDDATVDMMTDHKQAQVAASVLLNGYDKTGKTDIKLEEGKPFFLACGTKKPHLPITATKDLLDLFDEELSGLTMSLDRDLLESFFQDCEDLPEEALKGTGIQYKKNKGTKTRTGSRFTKVINEALKIDPEQGDILAWKDLVKCYLAATAVADRSVGHVLDALEKSPYANNTIVILWNDHGYHLGEKGKDAKFTLWDEASRVFFTIKDPRRPEGLGKACDAPVTLVDLYPTVVDMLGVSAPNSQNLDGKSLLHFLDDPSQMWDRPALTSFGADDSIRVNGYTYIRYGSNPEAVELYDRIKDPDERTNLAQNPEYQEKLKEMNGRMDQIIEATLAP